MIRFRFTACVLALSLWGSLSATPVGAQTNFNWNTATRLAPGVLWTRYQTDSPRLLSINAMRIDVSTPGLHFVTANRRTDWVSNSTETDKQSTRQFITLSQATSNPVLAAINATPWSPFPADDNVPANLQGLVVNDGILISPGVTGRPSFVVDNNGAVSLMNTSPSTSIANMDVAVSGFQFVLNNGVPVTSGTNLEPRTGLGISQDARYVYFMTIDGRRYSSQGATIREVGQYLSFFGAYSGLNMDGGGSTTMARWNFDSSSAELLNVPNSVDLIFPGDPQASIVAEQYFTQIGLLPNERAVGNSLGIVIEGVPEAGAFLFVGGVMLAWALLLVKHRLKQFSVRAPLVPQSR